ncbi:hypothetical protein OB236_26440, partial [Paenibacillus sp. WQ 127069]
GLWQRFQRSLCSLDIRAFVFFLFIAIYDGFYDSTTLSIFQIEFCFSLSDGHGHSSEDSGGLFKIIY